MPDKSQRDNYRCNLNIYSEYIYIPYTRARSSRLARVLTATRERYGSPSNEESGQRDQDIPYLRVHGSIVATRHTFDRRDLPRWNTTGTRRKALRKGSSLSLACPRETGCSGYNVRDAVWGRNYGVSAARGRINVAAADRGHRNIVSAAAIATTTKTAVEGDVHPSLCAVRSLSFYSTWIFTRGEAEPWRLPAHGSVQW